MADPLHRHRACRRCATSCSKTTLAATLSNVSRESTRHVHKDRLYDRFLPPLVFRQTETECPPHIPTARLYATSSPASSCSSSPQRAAPRHLAPRAQRGPKGSLLPGSIFLSSPVFEMLTVRMRPPEEPSRAIAWEMHF